ncbi:MAG: ribulose 1,5-bisphosphate carboxylase large subunit [Deltaproteobacteria bacterium]|nr:ribulose 1,5-bisphosphate carboxylase large subunit [Deltaproteobacteria bacterium]
MRSLCGSGEEWIATYEIRGGRDRAARVADAICVEQTVEFPGDLIDREDIRSEIVGRVIDLTRIGEDRFAARIAYAIEIVGGEVAQLLNVAFGNTSIQRGVRLVGLDVPASLRGVCPGPRFGADDVRRMVHVPDRPLVASALKPMGMSPRELADLAAAMVRGGIDVIKDDHGLTDQPFCRFDDRVRVVADAVNAEASRRGRPCLYAANVTADGGQTLDRAALAREGGAGAVMIAPGIAGFAALHALAASDEIALPFLCHPALLGAFTSCDDGGMSHAMIYATLPRLFGADAVIFPNHGGRFPFTPRDCGEIAEACRAPREGVSACFPVPAGGMTLALASELARFYGPDTNLLIGGEQRRGGDVEDGCRRFLDAVEAANTGERT